LAEAPRGPRVFDGRAVLALLAVQVCFAVFPVLGKIAMREIPPFVVAAFRAVVGAVLLTAAARLLEPGGPRLERRDHVKLAGLSLIGIVANQILYINGLARTTATNATLLTATVPVFTLVLALFVRAERPSFRRILGVPMALAGVLLLLNLKAMHLGDATLTGDLLVAVNSIFYAAFLVGSREILSRHSAIVVTASVFRWAAAPILLLAIPDLLRFRPGDVHAGSWLALAGIGLFPTLLAYFLNAWALSRTSPSTTAVFIYVQPLIAMSLAFLVLGERPGPRTAVAAVLIFVGIALTTIPGRPVSRSEGVPGP
jgi:drug/metabolite transporter (DMT)-like permease